MSAGSSERAVIGVDVGGTKVAAGVVDASGRLLSRVQVPTALGSAEQTLDCIAAAAHEALSRSGYSREQITAVGLGIPGAVDPERGLALLSVNLGWRDVAVRDEVARRIGLSCAIENDVRAAALGELRFGAGRHVRNLVYVSLGTGIAAGIILDGRLYRGAQGLAGELGHFALDPDGPRCACGARGCWEALAAGPAIARMALRELEQGRESLLATHWQASGTLSAAAVFAAAAQRDALALQILDRAAEVLARGFELILIAYNPERIIVGGGVALAGPMLVERVEDVLARRAQEASLLQQLLRPAVIQLSELQADPGVYGAAALVLPTRP